MVAMLMMTGLLAIPVLAVPGNMYTVSYYPNNGDDSLPAAMVGPFLNTGDPLDASGAFTIAGIEELGYEKAGYRFIDWNTEEDGNGQAYSPGCLVWNIGPAGGNLKLYAQWEELPDYTVSYHPNNGDETIPAAIFGPFVITTDEFDASGAFVISDIKDLGYTKEDYEFDCWNTKEDGSGDSYYPGTLVWNLTDEDNSTVHLYAQWTKKQQYVLSYHPNNGRDIPAALYGPFEVGSQFQMEDPEELGYDKPGYYFNNWNTEADGTGTAYAPGEAVTLEAYAGEVVHLYAQWTPYYIVSYHPNNGNDTIPAMLIGPIEIGGTFQLAAIEDTGFTKAGYKFIGWNTKANGTGIQYQAGEAVKDLSQKAGSFAHLYAQWTKKSANTLKVSPASKTYKRAKLTTAKVFKIKAKYAKGKVTYTLDNKAKKANIKVTKNGKVTVPKYCKRGTYKITVKAAGTNDYNPGTKIVKISVK